jgi:hypothetical protein
MGSELRPQPHVYEARRRDLVERRTVKEAGDGGRNVWATVGEHTYVSRGTWFLDIWDYYAMDAGSIQIELSMLCRADQARPTHLER